MKKLVLGMICISTLGLSGCQSNNKKAAHLHLKTEHSAYRISSLESSPSKNSLSSSITSKNSCKSKIFLTSNYNSEQNNTYNSEIIKSSSNDNDSTNVNSRQSSSSTIISNENAAGVYLKQQLGYGNDPNIVAGSDPNYDGNDQNGHFYTVSLKNLSNRLQGKTGSMGIYKVYSNGKIIQVAQ